MLAVREALPGTCINASCALLLEDGPAPHPTVLVAAVGNTLHALAVPDGSDGAAADEADGGSAEACVASGAAAAAGQSLQLESGVLALAALAHQCVLVWTQALELLLLRFQENLPDAVASEDAGEGELEASWCVVGRWPALLPPRVEGARPAALPLLCPSADGCGAIGFLYGGSVHMIAVDYGPVRVCGALGVRWRNAGRAAGAGGGLAGVAGALSTHAAGAAESGAARAERLLRLTDAAADWMVTDEELMPRLSIAQLAARKQRQQRRVAADRAVALAHACPPPLPLVTVRAADAARSTRMVAPCPYRAGQRLAYFLALRDQGAASLCCHGGASGAEVWARSFGAGRLLVWAAALPFMACGSSPAGDYCYGRVICVTHRAGQGLALHQQGLSGDGSPLMDWPLSSTRDGVPLGGGDPARPIVGGLVQRAADAARTETVWLLQADGSLARLRLAAFYAPPADGAARLSAPVPAPAPGQPPRALEVVEVPGVTGRGRWQTIAPLHLPGAPSAADVGLEPDALGPAVPLTTRFALLADRVSDVAAVDLARGCALRVWRGDGAAVDVAPTLGGGGFLVAHARGAVREVSATLPLLLPVGAPRGGRGGVPVERVFDASAAVAGGGGDGGPALLLLLLSDALGTRAVQGPPAALLREGGRAAAAAAARSPDSLRRAAPQTFADDGALPCLEDEPTLAACAAAEAAGLRLAQVTPTRVLLVSAQPPRRAVLPLPAEMSHAALAAVGPATLLLAASPADAVGGASVQLFDLTAAAAAAADADSAPLRPLAEMPCAAPVAALCLSRVCGGAQSAVLAAALWDGTLAVAECARAEEEEGAPPPVVVRDCETHTLPARAAGGGGGCGCLGPARRLWCLPSDDRGVRRFLLHTHGDGLYTLAVRRRAGGAAVRALELPAAWAELSEARDPRDDAPSASAHAVLLCGRGGCVTVARFDSDGAVEFRVRAARAAAAGPCADDEWCAGALVATAAGPDHGRTALCVCDGGGAALALLEGVQVLPPPAGLRAAPDPRGLPRPPPRRRVWARPQYVATRALPALGGPHAFPRQVALEPASARYLVTLCVRRPGAAVPSVEALDAATLARAGSLPLTDLAEVPCRLRVVPPPPPGAPAEAPLAVLATTTRLLVLTPRPLRIVAAEPAAAGAARVLGGPADVSLQRRPRGDVLAAVCRGAAVRLYHLRGAALVPLCETGADALCHAVSLALPAVHVALDRLGCAFSEVSSAGDGPGAATALDGAAHTLRLAAPRYEPCGAAPASVLGTLEGFHARGAQGGLLSLSEWTPPPARRRRAAAEPPMVGLGGGGTSVTTHLAPLPATPTAAVTLPGLRAVWERRPRRLQWAERCAALGGVRAAAPEVLVLPRWDGGVCVAALLPYALAHPLLRAQEALLALADVYPRHRPGVGPASRAVPPLLPARPRMQATALLDVLADLTTLRQEEEEEKEEAAEAQRGEGAAAESRAKAPGVAATVLGIVRGELEEEYHGEWTLDDTEEVVNYL